MGEAALLSPGRSGPGVRALTGSRVVTGDAYSRDAPAATLLPSTAEPRAERQPCAAVPPWRWQQGSLSEVTAQKK